MNEMLERSKQKTRGITLVVLVITIIILLVIAGVAIALVLGPNGIIIRAKEAKSNYESAKNKESNDLEKLEETITGFNKEKKVNNPIVYEGMIPVKWDTNKSNWVVTTEEDNQWYEYGNQSENEKRWANVMLSDGKYKAETVEVGTEIEDTELGSMFVWIPRFAYKITNGYHGNGINKEGAGTIDVQFLVGETNQTIENELVEEKPKLNGDYETATAMTNFVLHPSFSKDTEEGGWNHERKGFWAAKFEASSNQTTEENPNIGTNGGGNEIGEQKVQVKPNLNSWKGIDVVKAYTICKNMKLENRYQLKNVEDTHLMKNSEWGAISYLAKSHYGNIDKVWNNSYSDSSGNDVTKTGCSGENADDFTARDNVQVKKYNTYQEGTGPMASTTGTVYGIYDLAGGAWEMVSAFIEGANNEYGEFYTNQVENRDKNIYQDAGQLNAYGNENYLANCLKIGDSIWETSYEVYSQANCAWELDYSGSYPYVSKNTGYVTAPFFKRGGAYYEGTLEGIFAFRAHGGTGVANLGFRPVIY